MYLKNLFKQSKCWFTVVAVFIVCQLFINFKHGMVFSPFYHYGMYSEVMKPQQVYPVFGVVVDGEELKAKDFTPQEWDKIIQPVDYYSKHQQWNNEMFAQAHRLTGINDSAKYFNRLTKNDFNFWYQQYLSQILGREITSFSIQLKTYQPERSF
jgi:hypothetical protein